MVVRRARTRIAILACLAASLAGAAMAVEPDEILADAGLEGRARALSAELRCLVCQNQSIDDSNAPLARDLRLLVRERLRAGDSDAQVRAFVVARYGTFVLLKPPLAPSTLLLWLAPLLLLAGAGGLIMRHLRRPAPARTPEAPLTREEQARLAELVGQRETERRS
jgi:cytochrome c-type biogenesis protein CcmH